MFRVQTEKNFYNGNHYFGSNNLEDNKDCCQLDQNSKINQINTLNDFMIKSKPLISTDNEQTQSSKTSIEQISLLNENNNNNKDSETKRFSDKKLRITLRKSDDNIDILKVNI